MKNYDVIIIGGGASGFFAAINIAEKCPDLSVAILEKSKKLLTKVKVSGGGRCNVTHHNFDPSFLVKNYPRGEKKLYSIFKEFNPSHVISWFAQRGVQLKTEDDNRMFPESNKSDTIIDCFLRQAQKLKVDIIKETGLVDYDKVNDLYHLTTTNGDYSCSKLIVSCGSSNSMLALFKLKGYDVEAPLPSLFTFNIDDPRIKELPGLSFKSAKVKVVGSKLEASGPLLITHWGLSGPGILRLSAWGAQPLAEQNYNFSVQINFTGLDHYEEVRQTLHEIIQTNPQKTVYKQPLFDIPKRFWSNLLTLLEVKETTVWSELPKKQFNRLIEELAQGTYVISGKSTFKEEFVTCGGIKLSEIDLKTFESRKEPNLYFTGEFLNIDAITGGFNFQACWSGAWLVSEAIMKDVQ